MKQYTAYHPDMEYSGALILGFINCMSRGKENRIAMLAKHGIANVVPEGWYSQQAYLDTIKEIEEQFGGNTLYAIGLATVSSAIIPPVKSLEEFFQLLDLSTNMNCRLHGKPIYDVATRKKTEDVGSFTLLEYNDAARKAVVHSNRHIPSRMEEGVLTGLVLRFKPTDSNWQKVEEDYTKERKSQGGETSTYLVSW